MEKRKILLIDDDVDLTELLKATLKKTGKYEVRLQNSGSRGLDSANLFKPDLFVLNFSMPDMDGAEVAQMMMGDEDVKPGRGLIGGIRFIAKLQPLRKLIASIEENIPK